MQASIKYNYVFLCNTKCASTSVESALEQHSDIILKGPFKHDNFRRYELLYKGILIKRMNGENISTTCLVRDPISWLESWYRYRTRDELKNPKFMYHANSTAHLSFNEFVESYLKADRPPFANVGSQYNFVINKEGKSGIDHIFALEKIGVFIEYLESKIKKKLDIPELNKSEKKELVLDSHLKNRLMHMFEKDFEIHRKALEAKALQ